MSTSPSDYALTKFQTWLGSDISDIVSATDFELNDMMKEAELNLKECALIRTAFHKLKGIVNHPLPSTPAPPQPPPKSPEKKHRKSRLTPQKTTPIKQPERVTSPSLELPPIHLLPVVSTDSKPKEVQTNIKKPDSKQQISGPLFRATNEQCSMPSCEKAAPHGYLGYCHDHYIIQTKKRPSLLPNGPIKVQGRIETRTISEDTDSSEDEDGYEDLELPIPWKTSYDETGDLYFYNPETRESSWEPPPGAKPMLGHKPSSDNFIPLLRRDRSIKTAVISDTSEWEVCHSEEGKVYFYNKTTKISTWNKPDDVIL